MKKLKYIIYNNPKESRAIILIWLLCFLCFFGLNQIPESVLDENTQFLITIAVSIFSFIVTIVNYLKIEKKSKRQSAKTIKADLY